MFMNSLIIAFIILSVVGAADDNDGNNNFDDSPNLDVQQPDTEAIARSTEVGEKAENAEQTAAEQKEGKDDFLAGSLGKPKFTITSITPAHGPITGDTKITVRGGPFAKYSLVYTEPKCRFGNNTLIVGATYVSCTVKARNWDEKEAKKAERSDTCV